MDKELIKKNIALFLTEHRKKDDLSQTEMGRILNVTQGRYNEYESCTTFMSLDKLILLADHYNVPLDVIVGRMGCNDLQSMIHALSETGCKFRTTKDSVVINGLPSGQIVMPKEQFMDLFRSAELSAGTIIGKTNKSVIANEFLKLLRTHV
jgi:transcriptional regulator with XRE-family HTH domain